jgi:hypothetical protein
MYFHPTTDRKFLLHSDIRAAFPSVLFPDTISDSELEYCGVFPLVYERPQVGPQQVAEPSTIDNVGGQWVQLWNVRDMTPKELEASKPLVPHEVSMRQARLALLARGVLDLVGAAIDLLPSPERAAALIEWNHSSVVARDSPLVEMMGAALGLDDDALDELFFTAARL